MFDPPLKQIAKDVEKDIAAQSEMIFRAQALQVFSKIVGRTPVDEGTARGGWQVSIFRPDLSGGSFSSGSKGGTPAAIGAANNYLTGKIQKNPKLVPFWLSNPLPYVERLEFGTYGTGAGITDKTGGTGFSRQAPRGMIRVTFAEFGLS